MVLLIAATVEIVVYTQDPSAGCGHFDYYYYSNYRKMCQKSSGILALMSIIM